MSKLWYRTRSDEGRSKLHEVDLSAFRVTEPTVIYLSGFLTTNKQPGFIAGALKRLEEMLDHRAPENSRPARLYSWSHSSLGNLFNMVAYNGFPKRAYSKAGTVFAQGVLLPLVAKDATFDKKGRLTGATPLPEEEARKNLRNLTLLTYSAGTVTVQESFNAILKMMKKSGYAEAKARDILREVVLISTGNVSRPSKEGNRFTTLYLVASNDIVVRGKNILWAPLKTTLSNIFRRHSEKLRVERLSETSLFVSARLNKEEFEWRKRKDVTWLDKINPLLPAWTMINSNHELPYYITHDDKISPFANIALYSLTNAVGREKTADISDIIAPPPATPTDAVTFYTQKMEKAAAIGKR